MTQVAVTPSEPPEAQPAPRERLTPKQEAFCIKLVDTGNRSVAYRHAYNCPKLSVPGWVYSEATKLAQLPHVAARIRELQESAAAEVVASKAQLIRFLWDRIMASRADVVRVVKFNCRNCWGLDNKYQWVSVDEFADACVTATKKSLPEPSMDGGLGFNPHREPNPACAHPDCMGYGHHLTVVEDTANLTGPAALIYEGVKETDKGAIEIKLADRSADMALLVKLTGYAPDKLEGMMGNSGPGALPDSAYDIPSTSTPEEASRKYLALVS
jgi:phage terminase small subunit